MTFFIMLPTFLIILFAIYFTSSSCEKPNGNILLGVTLPRDKLKNEEVLQVTKAYHKANLTYMFSFLTAIIPAYIIRAYLSILLLYFTAFTVALFYVSNKIYLKYFNELYALKKENEWFVGATHVVSIDTEVTRLKNTFPLSKLWFIPNILIVLLAFILYRNSNLGLALTLITLPVMGILFWVYHVICAGKSVVYSENDDINLALNKVYKRECSICLLWLSYSVSIFLALLPFSIENLNSNPFYFIALTILFSLYPIIQFIYTFNKIKSTRNKLNDVDDSIVYADDDMFWEKGYYYNPNDSRSFVEKRVGIGLTINMAKKGGKASNVALLCVLVFLVGLSISFMPLDFCEMEIYIENNTVQISAPMYSYNFPTDDIVSVDMLDSFPNNSRTNGVNSDKLYLGNFSVSGYGKSKVYINRKVEKYIVIELSDTFVFLNEKTEATTDKLYEELSAQ